MDLGTLLIRTDANLSVGTGHVMRCFALARFWLGAGGRAAFAIAEIPDPLRSRLVSEGFSLRPITATPGSSEDAAEAIAHARRLNAAWVVVDGDHFVDDFVAALRFGGLRVLLIDDFGDRVASSPALILNPNLGASEETYRERGFTGRVLAGPRYALLRPEFSNAPANHQEGPGNRVLITLGGSDPENLTPRIASALSDCGGFELTVVAGAGYPHIAELRAMAAPDCRVIFDSPNMADLMQEADLAVIAAGGTLWELLAVGCVVLSYSRNIVQKQVMERLAEEHVVVDLGDTADFSPTALVSAVRKLSGSASARVQMSRLGRDMVDGLGASRVVEVLRAGATS
jgi:UDP-2,4-diacetamido-2,4,6-trideoxy-beta-L-altropyranose hydrolase